jgi:hypothetical protein
MGAFAACSLVRIEPRGEVSLLGGELALPAFGVARVSRLIGKSDTTGKRRRWQVKLGGSEISAAKMPMSAGSGLEVLTVGRILPGDEAVNLIGGDNPRNQHGKQESCQQGARPGAANEAPLGVESLPALERKDEQERNDGPGQAEQGQGLQDATGGVAEKARGTDAENAVAGGISGELAAG